MSGDSDYEVSNREDIKDFTVKADVPKQVIVTKQSIIYPSMDLLILNDHKFLRLENVDDLYGKYVT